MEKTALSVWNSCLKFVQDNVEDQVFNTWFKPIVPVKLAGSELSIQVPSKCFYEWLEEHYVKLLRSGIARELGKDAKLRYNIVMSNNYDSKKPSSINIPSSGRPYGVQSQTLSMPDTQISELKGMVNPFALQGLRRINVDSHLKPNYSFQNLFRIRFSFLL